MELIAKLGLDWKILVAQLVNFGLLLTVLTLFVYRPILRLLDDRRERVRKAMEDVKAIENQKREIEQFKVEQFKKIDEECGRFLEAAKTQAETTKQEIVTAAEQEAKALLDKAKQQIADDRQRLMTEAQSALAALIIRITEKILEREFTPADQSRLLAQLQKELPTLVHDPRS